MSYTSRCSFGSRYQIRLSLWIKSKIESPKHHTSEGLGGFIYRVGVISEEYTLVYFHTLLTLRDWMLSREVEMVVD